MAIFFALMSSSNCCIVRTAPSWQGSREQRVDARGGAGPGFTFAMVLFLLVLRSTWYVASPDDGCRMEISMVYFGDGSDAARDLATATGMELKQWTTDQPSWGNAEAREGFGGPPFGGAAGRTNPPLAQQRFGPCCPFRCLGSFQGRQGTLSHSEKLLPSHAGSKQCMHCQICNARTAASAKTECDWHHRKSHMTFPTTECERQRHLHLLAASCWPESIGSDR